MIAVQASDGRKTTGRRSPSGRQTRLGPWSSLFFLETDDEDTRIRRIATYDALSGSYALSHASNIDAIFHLAPGVAIRVTGIDGETVKHRPASACHIVDPRKSPVSMSREDFTV